MTMKKSTKMSGSTQSPGQADEAGRQVTALEEQTARLQAILDTSVVAIVSIDEHGIIEMVNRATTDMFGWEEGSMIGRNVSIIVPPPHAEMHDGYIRAYLQTGIRKVLGHAREVMARRRDGTLFPIEITLSETRFGDHHHFTAVIRDISARKAATRELDAAMKRLTRANEYLRAVLNRLRVGTLLVDHDGMVDYFSDMCAPLLAKNESGAVHEWTDFFRVGERLQATLRDAMKTPEPARGRIQIHLPFGQEQRWFEIDIRDDIGDPSRRQVFLYDIDEIVGLRDSVRQDRYGPIIGRSDAVRSMVRMIERVASGEWTVMIEGPTGSGKELAARAIHEASPRRGGPFVAVNCAGLADSLLASQLFGHRKGAFTGAVADQQGFFEAANGGTLFLDEIGDISPQLQASLLRVLQEKEILRVGDTRPRKIDVRVLVATNLDLAAEVAAGRFRQDLLYRIRVARIAVPSLKERREDIPLLARHFMDENANQVDSAASRNISPAAMAAMVSYDWPGNIRELKAAVDYAWIHCTGDTIRPGDLPAEVLESRPVQPRRRSSDFDEKAVFMDAIARAGGNRTKAAELLGTSRATFFRRLKKLGLTS